MIKIEGYDNIQERSKSFMYTQYSGIISESSEMVTIKYFDVEDFSSAYAVELLNIYEEAQTIDSPFISKVLEIKKITGGNIKGYAVIFENRPGISLKEYTRQKKIIPREALDLTLQIAGGLKEIHRRELIHSEISPYSIFIDPSTREAKLQDTGIHKLVLRKEPELNFKRISRDLLQYISPEYTGRTAHTIDLRTDFYSLGITLYEILTGATPFSFKDLNEIIHAHIARQPMALSRANSNVPEMISEIVMKLISKDPEHRYQSAEGLIADISHCLLQLKMHERIDSFPLGLKDLSGRLLISQKLYGKDNEIKALISCFNEVYNGSSKVVLIRGAAGVGKTFLAREIRKSVLQHRGYFLSGKFDPTNNINPYTAIIQAIRSLIQSILTEKEEKIKTWKIELSSTIGQNSSIITDFIPELTFLMEKTPDVAEVGFEEAQNRFNMVFKNFLSLFAKREHPMAIFIDDLQWADFASLELIRSLMIDPDVKYMLIIGSYRDEEAQDGSQLTKWMQEIQSSEINFSTITLSPLVKSEIQQFIIDTTKIETSRGSELADIILQKTGGNPSFIIQFIKKLRAEELLSFNPEKGWQYDLTAIRQLDATDNVINLMIEGVTKLNNQTIRLLKAASVIGSRFTTEMLAKLYGKTELETFEDLQGALESDIIIQTSSDFRFNHNRLHEAVYTLLSEEEKMELHHRIARAIHDFEYDRESPKDIFIIAEHYSKCRSILSDQNEKNSIARLNLMAARKAKRANAFVSALKYLDDAISLLPDNAWSCLYDLAFPLHVEKAECEYLSGRFLDENKLMEELLGRARTNFDRMKIYNLIILIQTHQYRFEEAIAIGIEACKLFGITLPHSPGRLTLLWHFWKVNRHVKRIKIENILGIKELTDNEILNVLELLTRITIPAYFSSNISHRRFLFLIILKMMEISLKHGNSKFSSFIYVLYGITMGSHFNRYQTGYELGKIGILLEEKYHNMELKARVYHLFGSLICFWNQPFDIYIEYFKIALQSGMTSGDFLFTAYAIFNIFFHSIRKGAQLDSLTDTYNAYINFIKLSKYTEVDTTLTLFYRMILLLKGMTRDITSYDDDFFSEDNLIQTIGDRRYPLYLYYRTKIESLFLFGHYEKALDYAFRMSHDVDTIFSAVLHLAEYYFYFSLSLAAAYNNASGKKQRQYFAQLRKAEKKFRLWAKNCPENFMHQYHLIKAELSRIKGNNISAIDFYNLAVKTAHENSYINHEAIACEIASKYHMAQGHEISARSLIVHSYNCYLQWGADAKLRDIETQFSDFFEHRKSGKSIAAEKGMDYISIVNSLQAISSEIVLEKLLEKLMEIVLENAGAERGLFISNYDGTLTIEADAKIGHDGGALIEGIPLEERNDLLLPVINYVMRTHKHQLIYDARKDERFIHEQHVISNQPISILCLPVIRQSKLIGILYLENNIAPGAFSSDHLDILKLLASQAAISIENAQLYEKLTKEMSEHNLAEIALKDSEDRYRLVVETMNEGILVLDADSHIIFANSRFCEMIGYESGEIINRKLEDFLDNESRIILMQQLKKRRKGEHEPYEINLIRKDKRLINTVVSPRPIFDGYGNFKGSFGIFTDITDRKKIEEDLFKASKLESLGVLAGGIAHDFNNLLTAITGNISLAKLNIPESDSNHEILAEAEKASMRAKDLTQQLLTFSRGGEPIKKTSSVKKLLRETIDFVLSGSNVVCIYHIQDDLWNAEIDEGQISQVIHNLIINAMQAMKEGGAIQIFAANIIYSGNPKMPLKKGSYIKIDFIDHGPGIPQDKQKFIFDPYFTTKEQGSGLGLTVSYSIMKKHDGYIKMESTVGKGTTFTIYIPASYEEVPEHIDEKIATVAACGKVLLMDDEVIVLKVAGTMINKIGLDVDFAKSGEEAIDLYLKSMENGTPYDIVIMDLTVPGRMGGKEAIANLIDINPSVKAIVSSGYSNDPVMANYRNFGFSGVVAKPYRFEDLKSIINKIIITEK